MSEENVLGTKVNDPEHGVDLTSEPTITPKSPHRSSSLQSGLSGENHEDKGGFDDSHSVATVPTRNTAGPASAPPLDLSFIFVSGARATLSLDLTYLTKRLESDSEFTIPEDPANMTVQALKYCLLQDWKPEWDEVPANTDAIRLIFFGRILEDKSTLSECGINQDVQTPIIHVSVRPDFSGDGKSGGKNSTNIQRPSGTVHAMGSSCRCSCIIS